MEVNDPTLPKFPALQKCILIDARHRSRKEVANRIQASMLFNEVVEAESVSDALARLESEPFDSCFMGPTLSQSIVVEVLKASSEIANSGECAFLVLLSETIDPTKAQMLLSEYRALGAHGVIAHPGSVKSFLDGTVKGVILANSNSPWAPIAVLNGLIDERLEGGESWSIVSLELAFSSIATNLKDLAKQIKASQSGITPAEDWLTESGTPTEPSIKRLSGIIHEALSSHSQIKNSEELVGVLERLLAKWLVDCCSDSEATALKNLKSSLFGIGSGGGGVK